MDAVKKQLKQMYLFLTVIYICGASICLIWWHSSLAGFTLGIVVSAFNFYLTYISFVKLYRNVRDVKNIVLVGPFPKLLLIVSGSIICYRFPAFFAIVPFLVGVGIYPIGYFYTGFLNYAASARQ